MTSDQGSILSEFKIIGWVYQQVQVQWALFKDEPHSSDWCSLISVTMIDIQHIISDKAGDLNWSVKFQPW